MAKRKTKTEVVEPIEMPKSNDEVKPASKPRPNMGYKRKLRRL